MTYNLYLIMHTEDDTFKALSRKSFTEVIYGMLFSDEEYESGYASIVSTVSQQTTRCTGEWDQVSGGWLWEDFKEECIKRSKTLIRL